MSDFLGIRPVGQTIMCFFTTQVAFAGATLSGTPAISVYKNSTTESTAGVTLTVDYDSRTGLNQVLIDTSADAFYAVDNDYSIVITAGTVGGVSQVGVCVGSFRLSADVSNIDKTARSIGRGTVTTGASTTSLPTSAFQLNGAAASGVVANQFVGRVVIFDADTTTAGLRGAVGVISASSASNTPTLTVGTLPATPASGDKFSVI